MPVVTTSDGSKLDYETHGEGPTTLVFAHGAGGNHLSWWQQVPHFRDHFRCLTFDHRGFGRSTDATGQSNRAYRADLEALLNDAGAGDVALVAQSMGGFTCLTFAAAHPERVKALLMADTFLGVGDEELSAAAREVWASLPTPADPTQRTSMVGPSYLADSPAGVFLYQQVRALNPPRDGTTEYSVAEGAVPTDDLGRLTMPVLFLAGEDDAVIPASLVQQAHRLMPGSRYVGVPNAGHSVYWERPAEFNRILDEFLQETLGT